MNLATGEEANYADVQEYTTDLSKLFVGKDLLEIAHVKIELIGQAYRITAQSKEISSITVIYDGDKGKFVSN